MSQVPPNERKGVVRPIRVRLGLIVLVRNLLDLEHVHERLGKPADERASVSHRQEGTLASRIGVPRSWSLSRRRGLPILSRESRTQEQAVRHNCRPDDSYRCDWGIESQHNGTIHAR